MSLCVHTFGHVRVRELGSEVVDPKALLATRSVTYDMWWVSEGVPSPIAAHDTHMSTTKTVGKGLAHTKERAICVFVAGPKEVALWWRQQYCCNVWRPLHVICPSQLQWFLRLL